MRGWGAEIRRRLNDHKIKPTDEARIVEELSQHLEDCYSDLIARGNSEETAFQSTLRELDDAPFLSESFASALPRRHPEPLALGGAPAAGFWRDRINDLRFGLRLLIRNPLYAGVLVLTLGLGIGVNTAIFSVVDAILLQPYPFANSERLVMVWETDRNSDTSHEPASWPDIRDFAERSRSIEELAALTGAEATWTNRAGEAERLRGIAVTPNLPTLLGFTPLIGTLPTVASRSEGAPHVLVSESFWRNQLASDGAVVGSSLTLNGEPTVVAAVVPNGSDLGVTQIHSRADYTAPFASGPLDVWLLVTPTEEDFPRQTHPWLTLARLAPGANLETAQSELSVISAELEAAYPENEGRGVNLEHFEDVVFGPSKPTLWVLAGAAGLVLLITCANVANLMLVRMTSRRREIAVRAALGAQRSRIALQLFTETIAATTAGAGLGAIFSCVALKAAIALAPPNIPRIEDAQLDGRALAFTAALGITAALLVGLLPILQIRRSDIGVSLQETAARGNSDGRSAARVRAALVVAQTALAFTLVIGAGLLVRSLAQLQAVDPGVQTRGVIKAEFQLPPSRYPLDFDHWPNLPEINNFHRDLLSKVAALPDVDAAAIAGAHPLDAGVTNSFIVEGREAESSDYPEIRTRFISAGYLETLGLPLLSGRDLDLADDAVSPPVALLNEAAAARYFSGEEPLGERLRFWGVAWQVVGVIGNERFRGLDAPPEPAIYVPMVQAPQGRGVLLLRTSADASSLAPALRAAVRELDPEIALDGTETLQETLARSLSRPRFTAALVGLFGASAIILALIGLQGVLSYSVALRRAEMGIRLALGATRHQVRNVVVREGMLLALAGVLIGAAGALTLSTLLRSLLFEVSTTDPATFLVVASGTLLAALGACWVPATKATKSDPLAILKPE